MSTLQSPAISPSGVTVDFVTGDLNALARHMGDCARAHGRMAQLRGGLQRMHALAAGRVVTFSLVALIIGFGVVTVA